MSKTGPGMVAGMETKEVTRGAWVRNFLKDNARYLVSILASVLLTVAILLVPVHFYAALGDYGYLGVFLSTLLPSATVIFPSPTLAAAFVAGSFLSPVLVGLAAGLGAALGELTGYLVGLGGSTLAAQSRYYTPIRRFVNRYGLLAIFVFALIPNPLFDLAGIAAGAVRIRYWRFLLACFLGKALRFVVIAYLGYWSVGQFGLGSYGQSPWAFPMCR